MIHTRARRRIYFTRIRDFQRGRSSTSGSYRFPDLSLSLSSSKFEYAETFITHFALIRVSFLLPSVSPSRYQFANLPGSSYRSRETSEVSINTSMYLALRLDNSACRKSNVIVGRVAAEPARRAGNDVPSNEPSIVVNATGYLRKLRQWPRLRSPTVHAPSPVSAPFEDDAGPPLCARAYPTALQLVAIC